jgi:DNA-binding transcriptional LysR family regulator
MPLNSFNFNLLVHLDALLTEKHVTRAAERASVSQSAMSLALGKLRRHFNDELLQQRGNVMVPTPLAIALAAPVRAALHQMHDIVNCSVETDPVRFDRTLVLAATHFSTEYVLSRAIPLVAAQAPRLRLECLPLSDRNKDDFERGLIDFRIASRFNAMSRHPYETIWVDPVICVAWTGNPRVSDKVALEQLQEIPFVRVRLPSGALPNYERWFNVNFGSIRRIDLQVANFALALRLVTGTNRLLLCNAKHLEMYGHNCSLRTVGLPFHIPPSHAVLQWHRDADADPVITWFRSLLREVMGAQPEPAD